MSDRIAESKIDALTALNEEWQTSGKINVVRYRTEDGGVDFLLAIGKGAGTGPEFYSMVQTQEEITVMQISTDPLDVTTLAHGGKALCYCDLGDGNRWYLIYNNDSGVRQFSPLTETAIYRNLDDGFRWFFVDPVLKREDDFLSESGTIDIVTQNIEYFKEPTLNITLELPESTYQSDTNYYLPEGTESIEKPVFSINILNYKGEDKTDKYTISIESGEEVQEISDGKYMVWGLWEADFELGIQATKDSKTYTEPFKVSKSTIVKAVTYRNV